MTRIRVPGLRIPGIRVAHIIDSLRMGGAQQLLVTFAGLAPAWQIFLSHLQMANI